MRGERVSIVRARCASPFGGRACRRSSSGGLAVGTHVGCFGLMTPWLERTGQVVGSRAMTGIHRDVFFLYSANPGRRSTLPRVELVGLGAGDLDRPHGHRAIAELDRGLGVREHVAHPFRIGRCAAHGAEHHELVAVGQVHQRLLGGGRS